MFVVKVPGINGSTEGCENAGNEILKILKNETSLNEQGKPIDLKLIDLEEIHLNNSNLAEANKLIYKNAFESFDKEKVIFLGGDHSVSYSLTRAFFDYCQNQGDEPCLIVFDAHPDMMKPADKKNPTNREWLRALVEDGFPSGNILLVGVRNISNEEFVFLQTNKIKIISMNQLLENLSDSCEIIMEFANKKKLYFSLDLDVVDSAFAPAVSSPESGGLSSRELIYLIQRMNKMKNLRAVDIVEINTKKDRNNQTIKLGAKVLGEFL